MRAVGFWALFALLAPLLLLQAAWVQASARRMPLAGGPRAGRVDLPLRSEASDDFELLCLGESPMAGVGVDDMELAVNAQLAKQLAQQLQRPVHWRVLAGNGYTALRVWRHCLPALPEGRCDVALIALGVNDTTALTSLNHFAGQIAAIARVLRQRYDCPVFVASVPPIGAFTALPQPLRWMLGRRADLLQAAILTHPQAGSIFEVLQVQFPLEPRFLAEDGYHPSREGHAWWGHELGRAMLANLPRE